MCTRFLYHFSILRYHQFFVIHKGAQANVATAVGEDYVQQMYTPRRSRSVGASE